MFLEAISRTTLVARTVLMVVTMAAVVPALAIVAEAAVAWGYRLLGHAWAAGLQLQVL